MNKTIFQFSPYLFVFFLLAGLSFACESDPNVQPGNPEDFPNFSSCNCDADSLNIVCTPEGKWFRNPCFANCMGVNSLADTVTSCPDSIVNPLDTLTWPIQLVCHPVLPAPPIVARLSDSTFIFQVNDSTFIRGIPFDLCRCLPAETMISTPRGDQAISSLTLGEEIYTKTIAGNIEIQPIIQLNRVPASTDHKLLHIRLADGREIDLTPEHPAENGVSLDTWEIGDELAGSTVISKEYRDFSGTETWDLLPAGETGVYQANKVWMGSTLKQKVPVYTAPVSP